jgi:hypothetical protein
MAVFVACKAKGFAISDEVHEITIIQLVNNSDIAVGFVYIFRRPIGHETKTQTAKPIENHLFARVGSAMADTGMILAIVVPGKF